MVAVKETVVLLSIYDKSETEDISEAILRKLLEENSLYAGFLSEAGFIS